MNRYFQGLKSVDANSGSGAGQRVRNRLIPGRKLRSQRRKSHSEPRNRRGAEGLGHPKSNATVRESGATPTKSSSGQRSPRGIPCPPEQAFQDIRGLLKLVGLFFGLAFLMPAMSAAQQGAVTDTIGPAPAQISPPHPNYPFPDARGFVYSAEWHLITAGTGVVRMDVDGDRRKVTATAESSGAVNVIFPVHDHFESRFDPRTFCSLSIFKHSEEGTHKRETSIQLDYAHKKSTLDEKSLKTGETKHVENDLEGCTTDIVTGFYYLQSLPLQLGARYEFPISDGKSTIVRASVDKREQIKVPAGTFQTVMITAEATSGPLQAKGKVWVWYSDDPSHTPVQMRVKLGWGTLLFRLQRIEK
jgi:Protein of unknown function (DUF3108)